MKKIASLLIVGIIFSACNIDIPNDLDEIQSINTWVNENIVYTPDVLSNYQLPKVTFGRGKGDCEDMAILLMFFIKEQLGIEAQLVIYHIGYGYFLHAIVEYNGAYFDPTIGEEVNIDPRSIWETLSYDQAMRRAFIF